MTYDTRTIVISIITSTQGYYIKNNTDCQLSRHSVVCNGSQYFDECPTNQSWSLTFGVGCVSCDQILNCNRCDSPGQCTKCISNYKMHANGSKGCCSVDKTWSFSSQVCVMCPSTLNCSHCESEYHCSICNINYQFDLQTNSIPVAN